MGKIQNLSKRKIIILNICLRVMILNDINYLNKFGFVLSEEAKMKKKIDFDERNDLRIFLSIVIFVI